MFPLNTQIDNSTYLKLKQIAAIYMRQERVGHTLSPTALVNEAFLRLYSAKNRGKADHRLFMASAARDMRQILVDYARAKKADKRGGGVYAITLDEGMHAAITTEVDVLALNDALEKLALCDAVKVRIVEMRYFSGMTLEEVADELQMSVATVKRKWGVARAWLFRELAS